MRKHIRQSMPVKLEDGVVVGNVYDKYGTTNIAVRIIMRGFEDALSNFVKMVEPSDIHEIGCGEGNWVIRWNKQGIRARGSDFSRSIIEEARRNAITAGLDGGIFSVKSIYDLDESADSADLLVCVEVLEHVDDPEKALVSLARVAQGHVILSVPREPIWRILNVLRGKYIRQYGNTPGHIQHWSRRKFIRFVGRYFKVVAVKSPFPWTMVLCKPR